MSELKAVVLAAGKGTRLRTDGVQLPKVMRRALDRPPAWICTGRSPHGGGKRRGP